MKRQFKQIQPTQGKKTSGHAQANAAASQPEHTPTYPKKNGSGLLSSYTTKVNHSQQRPQAIFQPARPGSIGQLSRSPKVSRTETDKQHPTSGSLVSKEENSSLTSLAATSSSQRPAQQPPNAFVPPNAPQQPYHAIPSQIHLMPHAGTVTTTGASNNPPSNPPVMPKAYPNTGNLAFTNALAEVSPPRVANSPAGATPYTGFSPMPGTRPAYAPYGPPPSVKSKRGRQFPIWARLATGFVAFILLIAGGLLTYYEVEIAPSLNNIIGHEAIHHTITSSKSANQMLTANAGTSALSSQNRINILLLGSDTDGKNGAPLAQSDIVVTIDQQTHYVGMLSIPRDLQVTIPNNGAGKMDFAFSYGWQAQSGNDTTTNAEAGAGLAEDTIQRNFGIHIDRYAWVGLTGFIKVLDTAGGIDVDITHPMVDDNYPDDVSNTSGSVYDYRRLYIAPGPQHLNGTQALNYVRTRHSDLIGDFGRSARQQQVLSALKSKLATPDTISQTPQLLNDLNGYLLTDMQLDDLVFLGNLARNVNLNTVQHVTLSPPYSAPSNQNTNYLPNCSQIIAIVSQMFGIQANCIPQGNSRAAGALSMREPTSHSNIQASPTALQGDAQDSQQPTSQNQEVPNPNSSSMRMDISGGVHTLLDIMLMTVFQSFNAAQI